MSCASQAFKERWKDAEKTSMLKQIIYFECGNLKTIETIWNKSTQFHYIFLNRWVSGLEVQTWFHGRSRSHHTALATRSGWTARWRPRRSRRRWRTSSSWVGQPEALLFAFLSPFFLVLKSFDVPFGFLFLQLDFHGFPSTCWSHSGFFRQWGAWEWDPALHPREHASPQSEV